MKNLVLTLALVVGMAAMASAQSSASVSVNATLQRATLTWSATSATLSFGTITLPATTAQTTISTSSNSAVALNVFGSAACPISFSYPTTTQLTYNNANITYTADVVGSSSNLVSAATSLGSGTLSSDGYYYIWIGGNLGSLAGTQAPGQYSGTYTITVSYGS